MEGPLYLPYQEPRASEDASHASGRHPDDVQDGRVPGTQGDGEPGTEVLWKGLQKLENIAKFWEILERMRRAGSTSPVPERRRYG